MKRPLIIAEAGVNHNGSLQKALKMVDVAARAGVDYIKFQTFKAEKLVTAQSATAQYQKNNCNADSQLDMLRQLELTDRDFVTIASHCRERGVGFLSTPFDMESLEMLCNLGMDYIKIPSGEITNFPFLDAIASKGIPVILSTGMSTIGEIRMAAERLGHGGLPQDSLILLHCTTEYPAPLIDVNLLAMKGMERELGLPCGYSDHTQGIVVPVAAAALGAAVIEKHFTLSRLLKGPDHAASLEPDELRKMVKAIREVSTALGSEEKFVTISERKNIPVARKSIVAARKIKKGELFSGENITVKRPGTGVSPIYWDSLVGTAALRDYSPDEQIELP